MFCLYFLNHSQFGAAGTGVLLNFFFSCFNRLAGQQLYRGFVSANALRYAGRAYTVHAFAFEILFNDAVFEGMKGNHGQPSARLQYREGVLESALEHFQFLIHFNTQGLK